MRIAFARLPELVAEFGNYTIATGEPIPYYAIHRARLAAILAPVDEPLPSCHALATGPEITKAFKEQDGHRIEEVTLAALDELAELIRRTG